MIIKHFLFTDREEVNSFLAACPETGQALIIDAGGFNEQLEQVVIDNNLKVIALFITHDHYDHTDAVDYVYKRFPDIELIAYSYSYGKKVRRPKDSDSLTIGKLCGKIHHIPGHTNDMLVLCLGGHLFTGDTLFAGSVGGTTNSDNYLTQVQGIRSKLLTYPDDTIIHPGHGPDSSIGLERTFNPFL
ncbi:MAG: MBL fold metallo-hydrolase [Candidatus Hatepunaea meridiana]|nr:MBL fold metallo-hydrolase [Candidatus Hatepunaea meridiana]